MTPEEMTKWQTKKEKKKDKKKEQINCTVESLIAEIFHWKGCFILRHTKKKVFRVTTHIYLVTEV